MPRVRRLVPRLGGAALLGLVFMLLTGGAAALVLKAPWDRRRARMLPPNRACQVKQFALRDAQGRLHTSEEWRGRKGVVLFFLEPGLPGRQRLRPRDAAAGRALWPPGNRVLRSPLAIAACRPRSPRGMRPGLG